MQDAQLLETNSRNANTGQLLGFVAECGVKAVLLWLGYPKDHQGSPVRQPGLTNLRQHIDRLSTTLPLIETFIVSASGRSGAKYLALIPNILHFADWSVDHRYYKETAIPNSLANWKIAAQEVMKMLDQATKDGMS